MGEDARYIRFVELMAQHLSRVIQRKFVGTDFNPTALREIRDEIRSQVDALFARSSIKLCSEARGWIANQFFKTIRINDDQIVNDIAVINEYKLADMPYGDLVLLKNLFNQTPMGSELLEEFKRRSVA